MNRKIAALTAVAIIVGGASALVLESGSGTVNCQSQYDRLVEGNITSEKVAQSCKPIPEDIENQVLARAFTQADE